jgi:hypothetical protein
LLIHRVAYNPRFTVVSKLKRSSLDTKDTKVSEEQGRGDEGTQTQVHNEPKERNNTTTKLGIAIENQSRDCHNINTEFDRVRTKAQPTATAKRTLRF